MSYFTHLNHAALLSPTTHNGDVSDQLESIYRRLLQLHQIIQPKLRKNNIDLHANLNNEGEVCFSSVASPHDNQLMALSYSRSQNQAQIVESVMGREPGAIEPRCHPTIEVRVTPAGGAIELILTSDARYDQQNFAGKMTIANQRDAFYDLINDLQGNYRLGFWSGTHLDEQMSLSSGHMPPPYILYEWLETFAAGRDFLRIGVWYDAADDALTEDNIIKVIFDHIRELSAIYDFIAWNSNNDFHKFYDVQAVRVR